MGRCGPCRGSFVVCPKRIPTCNTMLLLLPKESIVFDCEAFILKAAAVRAAGVLMQYRPAAAPNKYDKERSCLVSLPLN